MTEIRVIVMMKLITGCDYSDGGQGDDDGNNDEGD